MPGYNASMLRTSTGYIGLSRTSINIPNCNPSCKNTLYTFALSNDMNVITATPLEESFDRNRYQSWSKGLEDPRLLTPTSFLAVCCDTNPHWKPEMVYCTFENATVRTIQPLACQDKPRIIQKNWIYLKTDGDAIHLLYSMNPIQVIQMIPGSGDCTVLCTHPGLSGTIHNGAAVQLTDGRFLVNVRVKQGHSFQHCLWTVLNADYTLASVSAPFRFDPSSSYEMCMSLHLEEENVMACVGLNDSHSSLFRIPLTHILATMT